MQVGSAIVMVLVAISLFRMESDRKRSSRTQNEKLQEDLEAKQLENNKLREEVYTLHDKIVSAEQFSLGNITVATNGVRPANGRFMLMRTETAIAAIKFNRQKGDFFPERGDYSKFEWYLVADTTADSFEDAETGEGEVYENYQPLGEKQPNVAQTWQDIGSKLRVQFGAIDLKWSSGGWLYWTETPAIQFAPTYATNIEEVVLKDPDRMWFGPETMSSD